MSGLFVERLHIQGGLSGAINLYGFQAPHLEALSIQKTAVKSVDLSGLGTLHWLDFSHNKLKQFTIWDKVPHLQHLDISGKQYGCLSISYLKWPYSLTFVDFSGARLCQIPLPCQDGHYVIKMVPERHCHGNQTDIKSLGLQDTSLQCISSTFFSQYDWSILNILKLSNNQLGLYDSDTQTWVHNRFSETTLEPDRFIS